MSGQAHQSDPRVLNRRTLERDAANLDLAREHNGAANLVYEAGDALHLPYESEFDVVCNGSPIRERRCGR